MNAKLIDTHCHLTHGRLRNQLADVLARAADAGVRRMVCAAGDLDESRAAARLADQHEGLTFLAGVHPHEAAGVEGDYLADLDELLARPRCAAIGEIGLDYHYDFSPREDQRRVFAQQLDLAARLGLAVVIHTREAFDDTLSLLGESAVLPGRVIFHSFTGDDDQARRGLDYGAALSFSGIVTFKKADDVRAAARLVPTDRMLIETDAPYLSPEPVRRVKTNEPAHVAHVGRFLADLRGMAFDDFAEQTWTNAERLLPAVAGG